MQFPEGFDGQVTIKSALCCRGKCIQQVFDKIIAK